MPKASKESRELPYYPSQKQAASVLGRDPSLIKQACTEDPAVAGKHAAGRIDKAALHAWLEDYDWRKTNPAPDSAEAAKDALELSERELRLRERKVELARAEQKLAKEAGKLLPLVEYQAALRVTIGGFEAALQQLPGRAADQIALRARASIAALLRTQLTAKQWEKVEAAIAAASIDTASVVEVLDTEIEAVRLRLRTADFLESSPAP